MCVTIQTIAFTEYNKTFYTYSLLSKISCANMEIRKIQKGTKRKTKIMCNRIARRKALASVLKITLFYHKRNIYPMWQIQGFQQKYERENNHYLTSQE